MSDAIYNSIGTIENLLEAWKNVKEKGASGGIDNVSIAGFEKREMENIQELHNDLVAMKYIPEPYRHIEIKKNENENRPLGLLTIRDKIVQSAVKLVIEPNIEKGFHHCSYAYRKNKNTLMAINAVKNFIGNKNQQWMVVCDIDNFFDSLPHVPLLTKLAMKVRSPATIDLIRCWMQMGRVDSNGGWTEGDKGVPQGAILSPLLSNFYLHPFDDPMLKHNIGYARYADDFVILACKKADATKAMETAKWYLTEKLLLTLNDQPRIIHVNDGFDFLGITFKGKEITISEKRRNGLLLSLSDALKFRSDGAIDPDFFTVHQNIRLYYGKIIPQPLLESIDNDFLDILRQKFTMARTNRLITNQKNMLETLLQIRFFSHVNNINRVNLFKKTVVEICHGNKKLPEKETPSETAILKDNANKALLDVPFVGETPVKAEKVAEKKDVEILQPIAEPIPPPLNADVKIARKRREYQKIESAGMELIINKPGVFAGISHNKITLRKDGRIIHSVVYKNLKNISIISDGISLSSNLIRFCSDNQITIHFHNHNGTPYAQFIAPSPAPAKTGIAQINSLNNHIAFGFIKASIHGKMKNQINLLKYYYKYRKHIDPGFKTHFDNKVQSLSKLQHQILTLNTADLTLYRQQVFAIEGQTAAIYWSLVKTLLADDVDFPGRMHQDATDIVNKLLNYGYGILYSRIWQALLHAGLNPYISYLHSSERNQPGLVFDCIEEFRQQAVDRAVFAMITKGEDLQMKNDQLHPTTRIRVAEKVMERLNTIETFRGKTMRLSGIIHLQAENLCSFITGKTKKYKPYVAKW